MSAEILDSDGAAAYLGLRRSMAGPGPATRLRTQ